MLQHEWDIEYIEDFLFGPVYAFRCINCGAYSRSFNKRYPKRIIIEGTDVSLTKDCLESLKILQTYWEKISKKKKALKKVLYKMKKQKYSR